MKIFTRGDFEGQDPIQVMDYIAQRIEMKVSDTLKKSMEVVKKHLMYMTRAKLVQRSGALNRAVANAQTTVTRGSSASIEASLNVQGGYKNKRGQYVRQYLGTHFGTGVKVIHAKHGMMAIPIKGGPANAFTRGFKTLATGTPSGMPGL